MLHYAQRDVLKWPFTGTGNFNACFGQGEPVFLLAIFGETTNGDAADVLVILEHPDGGGRTTSAPVGPLDRKMFTLKDVSAADPINWRLLDDAPLHEIGGPETLHVVTPGASSEGVTWNLEAWAIPVRLTDVGRRGSPALSRGQFSG